MKNKNKVIILASIIVGILLVTLGLTYAAISFNETKGNSQLVLGDIWMHYNETNQLVLNDAMPMDINTYKVNPVMQSQEIGDNELGRCINIYTNGGYEFDEGSDAESFCKGTGTILDGKTIEEYFVGWQEDAKNNNYDFLEYGGQELLDAGVILSIIENLPYFEFTIDGKNTHTKGNVIYNIQLVEGDVPTIENISETLNRINSKYLRFRLTEVNGSEEKILKDNVQYDSLTNVTIHSDTILKNTTSEINRTYRLYMWIDGNVIVGNTSDANYSMEEWNNLYASVKVNVNGNYVEAEILTEKIKNKLGTEGLVAVNTEGNLYDGTGTIREYRYSGIGNYCTYTDGVNDYNLSVEGNTCPTSVCQIPGPGGNAIFPNTSDGVTMFGSCADMNGTELPLKVEGSTPIDSGLRNYVEFNGELWRIVGVFGDNVKIVKDTPISNDAYSDTTYTTGDVTYNLKFTIEGTKYGCFIYNYPDDAYTGTNWNDWTKSGAMHYLNDETGNSYYVNNLLPEAKNMIEETTYHLGNVSSDSEFMISGTAKEVYYQERGTIICGSNIISWSNESNCNIWDGNKATWTGKIGLLYPSDYGYAANSNNWTTNMGDYYHNGGSLNNWMFNTDAESNWFMSPSAQYPAVVLLWNDRGGIEATESIYSGALRPVLNLKSTVMTISGDGSYNSPYQLT